MSKYLIRCVVVVRKGLTHVFKSVFEAESAVHAYNQLCHKFGIGLCKVKKTTWSSEVL